MSPYIEVVMVIPHHTTHKVLSRQADISIYNTST